MRGLIHRLFRRLERASRGAAWVIKRRDNSVSVHPRGVLMSQSQVDADQSRVDAKLRREAAKQGLRIKRSRWRANSVDNHGGWQIIDVNCNYIVAGQRFDMSDEEVAAYLAE